MYRYCVPRTARFVPGGMIYHFLNRGLGKQKLFFKDEDYLAFESVVVETLEKWPTRILSYKRLRKGAIRT